MGDAYQTILLLLLLGLCFAWYWIHQINKV